MDIKILLKRNHPERLFYCFVLVGVPYCILYLQKWRVTNEAKNMNSTAHTKIKSKLTLFYDQVNLINFRVAGLYKLVCNNLSDYVIQN